ncbi:hypothetical protein N234_30412 [Ralstonia pickettii DTP0602]|nr:hypothetical protein N234_30412 [Ralstonia pickettii DTP0602]
MLCQPTQAGSASDDMWSAIAELSSEQLHTIVDISLTPPNPLTDLASFRDHVLGIFENVAGFESTPPPESIMNKLWTTYRRTPVVRSGPTPAR